MRECISDVLLPYQRTFMQSPLRRKLWISSRQVGKSFAIAASLVHSALEHGCLGLSLCISTGSRAASEIIKKCATFAEAVKLLSYGAITYTCSFDKVQFSTGARVVSLPGSTDGSALRGWTAQCVAIDEAAFLPHLDSILQAIAPTLSRSANAQLLITSTPGGRTGPFYELFAHAQDDPAWHVQTTTIHDAMKDGLKVDLDSLHTLCPDPDVFAQEYECQFAAESSGICDIDKLVFKEEQSSQVRKVIGIDVGVKSDRSSIVIAADMKDRLYIEDIIVLSKASFEEQLEVISLAHKKHQFKAGFIDATGIGYGLSELVTKNVTPLIRPLTFTASNKTPMHEQLRTDLAQQRIVFNPKFKHLICQDLRMVQRFISDSGRVHFSSKHDSTGHADTASALVLAVEAWHKNPSQAQMPATRMPFSKFF